MPRGRVSEFNDKWNVVEALQNLGSMSAYHLNQLVAKGMLEKVPGEKVEGRRGRRPVMYRLTGKGKGYLALSKTWKRPVNEADTLPEVPPLVEDEAELEAA